MKTSTMIATITHDTRNHFIASPFVHLLTSSDRQNHRIATSQVVVGGAGRWCLPRCFRGDSFKLYWADVGHLVMAGWKLVTPWKLHWFHPLAVL